MLRIFLFTLTCSLLSARAGAFQDSLAKYHFPMEYLLPDFNYGYSSYEEYVDSASAIGRSGVAAIPVSRGEMKFDRQGNLVHFAYKNKRRRFRWKYGRFSEKLDISYDRKGRFTSLYYFHRTVAYSRGTYVFTTEDKLKVRWNDAKRTCSISGKGGQVANVAYVGDDEDDWTKFGTYAFDTAGKIVAFDGLQHGRDAHVDFLYDAKGRLVKRSMRFTREGWGLCDSIAFDDSPAGSEARHDFAFVFPGKATEYKLIEITRCDRYGHLVYHEMTAATPLFEDLKRERYAKRYEATWDEKHLLQEDWFDEKGTNYIRNVYEWGEWEKGYFRKCTELQVDTFVKVGWQNCPGGFWIGEIYFPEDTTHGDSCISWPGTLSVSTGYYNPYGLLLKTSVSNYTYTIQEQIVSYRKEPVEYTREYWYEYFEPQR